MNYDITLVVTFEQFKDFESIQFAIAESIGS